MYHFQFLLSNYFFSCRKKKIQALSDRVKELWLQIFSNFPSKGRLWAVCVEKGEGDLCEQRAQGDAQVSDAGRSAHPPAAHASGVGWGKNSYGCVDGIRLGTAREDGVPTSILHPACPLLQHLALQVQGWDQLCSIAQSSCFPFCTPQPTLSTQTFGFFNNHDEPKTN